MLRLELAMACGALIAAATGCAGNEHAEQAWSSIAQRDQLACSARAVSIEFSPTRVSVRSGDALLGAASLEGRTLGKGCAKVRARTDLVEGRLSKGIYDKASIRCSVPTGVGLQTHPIYTDGNAIIGSGLLVLYGRRILVSAPLKPGGSRVYYDLDVCSQVATA